MENNEFNKSLESLSPLLLLYINKWFVIIVTSIVTIGMTYYAYQTPVYYKSTVNAVPPNSQDDMGAALGSVTSALKDFGLTKLGGSSSDSYSMLVLLQSRELIDSLIIKYDLAKEYDIPQNEMTEIRKQFAENYEVVYEKIGNYSISIWSQDREKAAKMANDMVEMTNGLALKLFQKEAEVKLKYLSSRIEYTDNALSLISDSLTKFSQKYQIYAPQEQAKALSTSVAEIKAQEIQMEVLYEYNKSRYGENDPTTQQYFQLLSETKNKVKELSNRPGLIGEISANQVSSVSIQYAKLFAEFETFTKVKAFLLPMLEKAKLDVFKDVKSLYIVDKAVAADKKDKPRRSLIVLGGFIGGFVSSVLLVLFISGFNDFRKKYAILKNSINA